jgi:hypothetical protein
MAEMLSEELPHLLDQLRAHIDEADRLNRLDVPEPLHRSIISQLAAISNRAEKIALAVAVDGIRSGVLSRRAAADRLGMHPNTLERWIVRLEAQYVNITAGIAGKPNPISSDIIDKLS